MIDKKVRDKFLVSINKLPYEAGRELFVMCNGKPYSLHNVMLEVIAGTRLGQRFLKILGYEGDA